MDFSTGFGLLVIIFLIITAVLWFLLPFAVFGVKDLLKDLLKEQKRTNAMLQADKVL
nr:hypothetical protein [Pseudomonas sp.]